MENFETDKIADLRQSEEYARYLEGIGWKILKIRNIKVFIKKMGPISIAKIQRVKLPLPWKEVNKALKDSHVFMTILEPLNNGEEIKRQGFVLDKWPMIGNKSWMVNLDKPEFKKDARYVLRKLALNHIQYSVNNFAEFYEIWKEASRQKKLWIPPEKDFKNIVAAFNKKCFCICANSTAGAFILTHRRVAYYYYAANRKKNDLPYGVVREAMKEARKKRCKWWNWEGVYDSRWPNKSWLGFTHFKKSFGGNELLYPGTFVRWSWPL